MPFLPDNGYLLKRWWSVELKRATPKEPLPLRIIFMIDKKGLIKIDKPGQFVSALDLGQRLGPSIVSNAISTKLEMIEKLSFQT